MADSAKRTVLAKRTHRLSLADVREDYRVGSLDERDCETNPIIQFENWFKEVVHSLDNKEPNAMMLATAGPDGQPSARIVLLKEVSDAGFVFYTNYDSPKARDLETNPKCALTFYWGELERQVRVEGKAYRVTREQAEAYFRTRPRGSQLGAWASHQSEPIAGRQVLESKWAELEAKFAESGDVPLPEFWGGYCVVPESIEFWQGRTNRLHDRVRYRKKGEGEWVIERLSP
ncbi:MAG TPA: pyridoxamine 5'-phosphate oxidase [Bryobacteraceae bacterium]|jgi:pyridoxamine 5'-phosphate oxidase